MKTRSPLLLVVLARWLSVRSPLSARRRLGADVSHETRSYVCRLPRGTG